MSAEVFIEPVEPADNGEFTLDATDNDLIERGSKIYYTRDSTKAYLRDIGKTPLLNAEQEVELAKRIEAGLYASHLLSGVEAGTLDPSTKGDKQYWDDIAWLADDGKRAKDHLFRANLRLAANLAKRYRNRGMEYLEVVQEGNLGLSRAVEKFDYQKGYKFSTYATWWIRQGITRAIADKSRTIRIPVHMVEEINKVKKERRELLQNLDREPTSAEVAAALQWPAERVVAALKYDRQQPISLDTPVGETGGRGQTDTYLVDLIPDESSPDAHQTVEQTLLKEAVNAAINTLSEKEQIVVRMRFGLDGGETATLEEVGRVLELTRERVRQIQLKAERRLLKAAITANLHDLL
jgi:RNA polymerase primary sigma factor